jgi:hypothetical protein
VVRAEFENAADQGFAFFQFDSGNYQQRDGDDSIDLKNNYDLSSIDQQHKQ